MADDESALQELFEATERGLPVVISHYLYFPAAASARQVSELLRARGFVIEERVGADGINWLVLARHEVVPSEELLASTRLSMEAIAASANGEYDGWEAELRAAS